MATTAQLRVKASTQLVLASVAMHRRRDELRKVGKQRDSLLRALVPLYVVRGTLLEGLITSGVTRQFWSTYGVKVQATVMAKALREHVGYARRTRDGLRITMNGLKYVEAALRR